MVTSWQGVLPLQWRVNLRRRWQCTSFPAYFQLFLSVCSVSYPHNICLTISKRGVGGRSDSGLRASTSQLGCISYWFDVQHYSNHADDGCVWQNNKIERKTKYNLVVVAWLLYGLHTGVVVISPNEMILVPHLFFANPFFFPKACLDKKVESWWGGRHCVSLHRMGTHIQKQMSSWHYLSLPWNCTNMVEFVWWLNKIAKNCNILFFTQDSTFYKIGYASKYHCWWYWYCHNK